MPSYIDVVVHYTGWIRWTKPARLRLLDGLMLLASSTGGGLASHYFMDEGATCVLTLRMNPRYVDEFYSITKVEELKYSPPTYFDGWGTLLPIFSSPQDEIAHASDSAYTSRFRKEHEGNGE